MRTQSEDRIDATRALLAPVALDLLEHARAGHRVRVCIYASHDEAAPQPSRVTWTAEYVGLEETIGGRHPDEEPYRSPVARWDGGDHRLLFWHVVALRRLAGVEQVQIGRMRGRGKRTTFVRHFTPEGPLLIEPV